MRLLFLAELRIDNCLGDHNIDHQNSFSGSSTLFNDSPQANGIIISIILQIRQLYFQDIKFITQKKNSNTQAQMSKSLFIIFQNLTNRTQTFVKHMH